MSDDPTPREILDALLDFRAEVERRFDILDRLLEERGRLLNRISRLALLQDIEVEPFERP